MRMPNEMVLWKRVLAFVGFVAASLFIIYSVVHEITLDCEPDRGGVMCVHREYRAGIETDEVSFLAPPADRVKVSRHGKGGNRGDVDITTDTGRRVELTWMTHDDATDTAAALVRETSAGRAFHFETHGPRWWLLLLLFTVPVALSFVLPQRLPIASPEELARLPPPLQDKKRTRAERKAREHAARRK